MWELKPEDAKVGTSGTTKTYTYTKTYIVTIDPTDDAVAGNEYYPLNDETQLKVEGHDPIDFPIPAGKVVMPTYPVTWKGYDGGILKSKDFKHGTPAGEVEANEPDDPTRPADDKYTYTFTGWTPDYNVVTGSQTYTATYSEEARSYTVSYQYDDTAPAGAPTLPADEAHQYNTEVDVAAEPTLDGYRFKGWKTEDATVSGNSFTMPAKNVMFTGSWEATEFLLTINYEYEDGTKAAEPYAKKVQCGTDYRVTSPTVDGYTADQLVVSGTMPAEPVIVTVTYTKRSDLSYTVNYYWNDTTEKAAESKNVTGQTFGTEVIESPIAIEGYTPVSNNSKAITIGTDGNVITFYYYKDVELTANSKTDTYDGTEKSVSGFTGAPEDANFSAITVGATGTEVGNYPAEFPRGTVGTVDKTAKYIVKKCENAKLTINPTADKVTVTITGHTGSAIYDGTEKSVTGYDVTISNALYTENDFTFTGTAEAKGINAGTYPMNLTAAQFTNTNTNFTNVEFVVTDGELTISPTADKVTVTITGHTDSAIYDGKEHKVTGYDVASNNALYTADNFTFSGTAEAKGTNAGTYEMGLTAAQFTNNSKNFTNVEFVVTDGKLEITPNETEVVVTIKGNTDTKTYNGSEQSVTGYTVESISNSLYTANDFTFTGTAEAKGINAGTYEMGLTAAQFTNKSKNFTNVEFVVTDGELTIHKRGDTTIDGNEAVTITANSNSVNYDGKEHGENGFTSANLAPNQEVKSVTITGSEINTGRYPGKLVPSAAVIVDNSGNDVTANYVITYAKGDLVISPITDKVTVTIKGNTDSVRYNGKEHKVEGYQVESISNNLYTADSFTFSGIAKAKGTRVGTYPMGLKAEQFKNVNTNFTNVEFVVTDGKLTITRRPSNPQPPTVEIPDDDALGLNTTDHFAYIVGYGNGEVRPQNNITRAEVATIFFRLLTDDVRDENLTKTNRYSDVASTAWYNTAVSTLSSMGIITGYPDGTFRPNAAITRAEFAAIAARFDSNGDKTTAKFSDIATHWAKNEISIAYNNGWITGYPNGTFGPQRDITRAETMTLVNRVLNRQPETEDDLLPNMTVWTDNANPKAWYYLAVQEATNRHYYEFKTNSQYEKWTELRETRDWTQLEK